MRNQFIFYKWKYLIRALWLKETGLSRPLHNESPTDSFCRVYKIEKETLIYPIKDCKGVWGRTDDLLVLMLVLLRTVRYDRTSLKLDDSSIGLHSTLSFLFLWGNFSAQIFTKNLWYKYIFTFINFFSSFVAALGHLILFMKGCAPLNLLVISF